MPVAGIWTERAEQLVIRGIGLAARWRGRPGATLPRFHSWNNDGTVVRVGDIAEVTFGGEIRQGAVTMTRRNAEGEPEPLGQEEWLRASCSSACGANTKSTIDQVRTVCGHPAGVAGRRHHRASTTRGHWSEQAVDTVSAPCSRPRADRVGVAAVPVNLRATVLVLVSYPLSVGWHSTAMSY